MVFFIDIAYTANNILYKLYPRWWFVSSIRDCDHVMKTLYLKMHKLSFTFIPLQGIHIDRISVQEQQISIILAGKSEMLGLPTKKSKVLRFQICVTRTKYLSEIYIKTRL